MLTHINIQKKIKIENWKGRKISVSSCEKSQINISGIALLQCHTGEGLCHPKRLWYVTRFVYLYQFSIYFLLNVFIHLSVTHQPGRTTDHFSVVCLVTWPLDGSEAGALQSLFWYRPHWFCCVKQVVLMLTTCIYMTKAVRSVSKQGQVTKQTTVKWLVPFVLCFLHLCMLTPLGCSREQNLPHRVGYF